MTPAKIRNSIEGNIIEVGDTVLLRLRKSSPVEDKFTKRKHTVLSNENDLISVTDRKGLYKSDDLELIECRREFGPLER